MQRAISPSRFHRAAASRARVVAAVSALAACTALSGCESRRVEAQKPRLESAAQRFSYSVGAKLGRDLLKGEHELEFKLLVRGLEDALSGAASLTEEEAAAAIEAHLQQQREKQEIERAQRAQRAESEAQAFFAQNRARSGVLELASGLQYEILRAGSGPSPSASDFVTCHYRGTLLDGTVFDDTHQRSEPRTFVVSSVVAGFEEALQQMQPGAVWKLYLPPQLAYGRTGFAKSIPPSAALVFEVELLSVGARAGG